MVVRCSTTSRTFSESSESSTLIFSSSTVPLLCPRYRSSYPARDCANYIGDRENATAADNRNRLQTFRVVSSPRSHFHLPPPLSTISLFPACAFPPATTNNTSSRRRPRRHNKVVGGTIVHPVFLPRVRGRATTIVRLENETDDDGATTTRRAEDVVISREFVFPPCRSALPTHSVLSFSVSFLYL